MEQQRYMEMRQMQYCKGNREERIVGEGDFRLGTLKASTPKRRSFEGALEKFILKEFVTIFWGVPSNERSPLSASDTWRK